VQLGCAAAVLGWVRGDYAFCITELLKASTEARRLTLAAAPRRESTAGAYPAQTAHEQRLSTLGLPRPPATLRDGRQRSEQRGREPRRAEGMWTHRFQHCALPTLGSRVYCAAMTVPAIQWRCIAAMSVQNLRRYDIPMLLSPLVLAALAVQLRNRHCCSQMLLVPPHAA